jgi:hypothetical protein
MIGHLFGAWEVVAADPCKIKHFKRWLCRCKCGLSRSFTTSYINTGQATCCDHCKQQQKSERDEKLATEQVGRKYGNYTVISYDGKNRYGSRTWLCRCECGNERLFLSSYLFGNGNRRATQCPDCYNEEIELKNRIVNEVPERFWNKLTDMALKRGIVCDLTKNEAFAIFQYQGGKCALTGQPLHFTKLRSDFNRYTNASLDRIDSDKSYELGNVQWVEKRVNMMKGKLTQTEFVDLCKAVVVGL